jgi:hypothetical protein
VVALNGKPLSGPAIRIDVVFLIGKQGFVQFEKITFYSSQPVGEAEFLVRH